MSTADAALSSLSKDAWKQVTPSQRVQIIQDILTNFDKHGTALAQAEAEMKNAHSASGLHTADSCGMTTVGGMGTHLQAALALYQGLVSGKPLQHGPITKVPGSDDLYDVAMSPLDLKETIVYGTRTDYLRVQGLPQRVSNPCDKPTKLIATLGAGNYASAVEILKALFFDNHIVVHKPHPLNAEVDKIMAHILQPLVDHHALAFCAPDQGPALTTDARVDSIYFTGGVPTATAIRKAAKAPLVCESGGVNPQVIVPSKWTASQLQHHANHVVSMGKMNGGHICARPQVLVTCQQWPQREAFLEVVRHAIAETTFGVASYYPGTAQVLKDFEEKYPQAQRIRPASSPNEPSTDVLWIPDIPNGSYGCQREAFGQVFCETALDCDPSEFLAQATNFCNKQMAGTLVAGITIDDDEAAKQKQELETMVTELNYGVVGVNLSPVFVFFTPHLIWGGNDGKDGLPLVSGHGNFGNLFGYKGVKSIVRDRFWSPNQMALSHTTRTPVVIGKLTQFSSRPSWMNLFSFLFSAIVNMLSYKNW